METVNELYAQEPLDADVSPSVLKQLLETLVLMLFPIAPHISAELWEILGHPAAVSCEKWPSYSEDLAREEQVEIIIQVSGRMRGKILADASLSDEEIKERALADERIKPLLAGKQILKVVMVPKKLVNIVLAS
jgi:leucyl-tRNA synthetase